MGSPNIAVNVGLLIQKEVKYQGSFRYGVSIPVGNRKRGTE